MISCTAIPRILLIGTAAPLITFYNQPSCIYFHQSFLKSSWDLHNSCFHTMLCCQCANTILSAVLLLTKSPFQCHGLSGRHLTSLLCYPPYCKQIQGTGLHWKDRLLAGPSVHIYEARMSLCMHSDLNVTEVVLDVNLRHAKPRIYR